MNMRQLDAMPMMSDDEQDLIIPGQKMQIETLQEEETVPEEAKVITVDNLDDAISALLAESYVSTFLEFLQENMDKAQLAELVNNFWKKEDLEDIITYIRPEGDSQNMDDYAQQVGFDDTWELLKSFN